MTASKAEIIDLLPCTASQLAVAIGCTLKQAHGRLGTLKDIGAVECTDLRVHNGNTRGPKMSRLWRAVGEVARATPAEQVKALSGKGCEVAFVMTEKPANYDDYESIYVARLDKFFYIRAEVVKADAAPMAMHERLLSVVRG